MVIGEPYLRRRKLAHPHAQIHRKSAFPKSADNGGVGGVVAGPKNIDPLGRILRLEAERKGRGHHGPERQERSAESNQKMHNSSQLRAHPSFSRRRVFIVR